MHDDTNQSDRNHMRQFRRRIHESGHPRGRFIVPTADLSACGGFPDVPKMHEKS